MISLQMNQEWKLLVGCSPPLDQLVKAGYISQSQVGICLIDWLPNVKKVSFNLSLSEGRIQKMKWKR